MNPKFILLTLLLLAAPSVLPANDTAGIIMPTGNVEFHEQKGIKLETEALYISSGRIEVNYIFRNTTGKDITETVFLPLPPFDAAEDLQGYQSQNHNFNFECYINGNKKEIEETFTLTAAGKDITKYLKPLYPQYYSQPTLKEISALITNLPEKDLAFLKNNKLIAQYTIYIDFDGDASQTGLAPKDLQKNVIFYWSQTFPAGVPIHVKHIYQPTAHSNSAGRANSECVDSQEFEEFCPYGKCFADGYLEYILKTAANWQMPMASFNLLIESEAKSAGCFEGKPFLNKDPYYAKNLIDFTPTANMSVDFLFATPDKTPSVASKQKYQPQLFKIHGPAALRAKPNGKKTTILTNESYVWVINKKNDWYEVLQNDMRGWTYKDNLINIWKNDIQGDVKMSKPILVTDETFEAEVKGHNGPVMAEFFATWCGHCTRLQPVIEEIAKEYGNKVKVCKVDVDQSPKACDMYNISGTPTILFFKTKTDYKKIVGEQPKETIIKQLEEILK